MYPMKIALIRKNMASIGGAENYISLLITGLMKQGHCIELICAKEPRKKIPGITVHIASASGLVSVIKDKNFAKNAEICAKSGNYDVVISLERTLYQDIYRAGDGCHAQWLEYKSHIKGILSKPWEKINPLNKNLLEVERKLYDGTTHIIANSEMVKAEIKKHYKTPDSAITRIYNGIDLSKYNPTNRSAATAELNDKFIIHQNTHVFLFVGNGHERKGLKEALLALNLLNTRLDGNFKFLVLGKDCDECEGLVKKLDLAIKVRLLGEIENPLPYYHMADVMLFPTHYDPCSNACLEAMAAGSVVLTTKRNGMSELLEDYKNGYVVDDPFDSEGIYDRLRHWIQSEDKQPMIDASLETISHRSIEKNVEETLEVIAKLQD